tara:strand:+ start:61934 stop:62092 length:159 start_codon:yes stop_codon:yes gene_type:complete
MNQNEEVHDDEDELNTEDQGWGWMILPVAALGLIFFQIADACMTSVFDEEDE